MIAGSNEAGAENADSAGDPGTRQPNSARLIVRVMKLGRTIFGREALERAAAVLACAALLYFAAGGSLFHQHNSGPDTACHVCQALHLPALAQASLDPVAAPEFLSWHCSQSEHAAPCDSFDLHRASRAPPAA